MMSDSTSSEVNIRRRVSVSDKDGRQAEDAVAEVLRAAGWEVLNLNDLAGNWPLVDLSAYRGDTTVLIQVRGTRTEWGEFTTYPDDARRAALLGEWLGVPVIYGFWHLPPAGDSDARIRFAAPSRVTTLAQATIEANPGVNVRLHVWIEMFDIDIHRIDGLLDRPSRPAQPPDDESGEEAA
jgi:hypothetical protein